MPLLVSRSGFLRPANSRAPSRAVITRLAFLVLRILGKPLPGFSRPFLRKNRIVGNPGNSWLFFWNVERLPFAAPPFLPESAILWAAVRTPTTTADGLSRQVGERECEI